MTGDAVRQIIADHLDVPLEEVKPEALLSDLGADSLDLLSLVSWIDVELDVVVPDSELDKMRTVGDMLTFVEGACQNKS